MKKLFLLFVFLFPVLLFAQVDSTGYPQPGSFIDIFTDLKGWFASTATVAGLSIFLTLALGKVWKAMTQIVKQIVAVLIALVLVIAGNLANIGFMAEFNVMSTIVYGIVIGFMANGLYDTKNVFK